MIQHTGDSLRAARVFLCTWYLVPLSLYQSALRIVYLLPADYIHLAVAEEFGTLYLVT